MGGWSGPSGACSAAVGGAVGSDFFSTSTDAVWAVCPGHR